MDPLLTTLASILAIAALGWAVRRLLDVPLCPICLGVGGTWLWMLAARELGYPVDPTLLAVLLGGSVVGLASLAEKRLPPGRSPLLWKTLFIPAGFVAAHAMVAQRWPLALGAGAALLVLAGVSLTGRSTAASTTATVDELTRKMSDCC